MKNMTNTGVRETENEQEVTSGLHPVLKGNSRSGLERAHRHVSLREEESKWTRTAQRQPAW